MVFGTAARVLACLSGDEILQQVWITGVFSVNVDQIQPYRIQVRKCMLKLVF